MTKPLFILVSEMPEWTADPDGAQIGNSVAAARDVNGDGYGDVIVGAPGDFGTGLGAIMYGRAFVYPGSASAP